MKLELFHPSKAVKAKILQDGQVIFQGGRVEAKRLIRKLAKDNNCTWWNIALNNRKIEIHEK